MALGKRVTIADIARMAGVSPGAVSFALNGRPGVSDETRQRILTIVAENHWQPSSAARALVGARANTVGFALARPARSLGSEAFFTDLIAGIESRLSQSKVSLQLRLVGDIAAMRSHPNPWRSFLAGCFGFGERILEHIAERYVCTRTNQLQRELAADAASRPGDHG